MRIKLNKIQYFVVYVDGHAEYLCDDEAEAQRWMDEYIQFYEDTGGTPGMLELKSSTEIDESIENEGWE